MCRFICALFIVIPYSFAMAIQLQYIPSVLVQQTNNLTFELEEPLPLLNLKTKGQQNLKFDFILKDNGKNQPLSQLPLALILKLKEFFVFLNINGVELTVDASGKKSSIPLIQLEQLLDKPMLFVVNSKGHLIEEGDSFKKVFKEQPALKDLPFELFLNEIFFPIFALCGEELEVGKKFEKDTFTDPSHSLPATVTFTITEINDQEIIASIEGVTASKRLALEAFLNQHEESEKKMEMTLSGSMKGTISWKRNNALLYTLNNHYNYQAEVNFGSMRGTMRMIISNVSSSSS